MPQARAAFAPRRQYWDWRKRKRKVTVRFAGVPGASPRDPRVTRWSHTVKCSARREQLTEHAQERTVTLVMWKRAVHKRDTLHAGRFVGGV